MRWVKFRWFLAALLLLFGFKLMVSALSAENAYTESPRADTLVSVAPLLILSFASFLFAVIVTAPETALRAAQWCGDVVASFLLPDDRFAKPPLNYRLARKYRDEMRFEEAATQYRKILRHYPYERDAFLELLDVATRMNDHELHREYSTLFKKRFKDIMRASAAADDSNEAIR